MHPEDGESGKNFDWSSERGKYELIAEKLNTNAIVFLQIAFALLLETRRKVIGNDKKFVRDEQCMQI